MSDITAVRVLQYTYGGGHVSGIDAYLSEAFRAIDRSKVLFDFLYRYGSPLDKETSDELRRLGAQISALDIDEDAHPILRQLQETQRLWQHLRSSSYDVIEINMTSTFMCIQAAVLAKITGTRTRIVHAHDAASTENAAKRAVKSIATPFLRWVATDYWACSGRAASYLFGRKIVEQSRWHLVKNSIDTARFRFSPSNRIRLKSELNLSYGLTIGLLGRLAEQKNPLFAIEVLSEVRKYRPDTGLVVIGDGPLKEDMERRCAEAGLQSDVTFLGKRDDVPALLSVLDLLVAPSRHEGFPIIALEAQASGLPIAASDAFPDEANVAGLLHILPRNSSPGAWAAEISRIETPERKGYAEVIRAKGYDREALGVALDALYAETIVSAKRPGLKVG